MSESENKNQIIEKFGPKVLITYLLTFFLPITMGWFLCEYLKIIAINDTFSAAISPLAIFMILFAVAYIILLYIIMTKKIYSYDGSLESLEKTNKTVKRFERLVIASAILNCPVMAFTVYFSCKIAKVSFDFAPFIIELVGSVFLLSCFGYIHFMQELEEALGKLPLRKKDKSMTLTLRSSLIIFFCVVGTVLYMISPVLSEKIKNMSTTHIVTVYQIPLGIFGVILTILCTFRQFSHTEKRIKNISEFTDAIVDRDYTKSTLKVESRDEFGLLVNDLNAFHNGTKELLNNITENVKASQNSANEVTNQMTETSSAMNQIQANISNVKNRVLNQSASVTETQSTIQNMIKRIEELNDSINLQSSGVSNSSSAVEEMVANIRSVAEILEKNSLSVNSLSDEAEEGRKKIDIATQYADIIHEKSAGLIEASNVVQNIASQTNLLAMNAAIEAAHAGEAGKGFAVVADEIRKLAEQSNTQGKEISNQLTELQNAINSITTSTTEVQKQFGVIFDLTNTVREQGTVIKNAMEEQSAGSSQVLVSINEIKSSSDTVQNNSRELLEGGKQIVQEMSLLSNITNEISSSMNEMVEGANLVTKAAQKSQTESNENVKKLNLLQNEVLKFKL